MRVFILGFGTGNILPILTEYFMTMEFILWVMSRIGTVGQMLICVLDAEPFA